jgi:hypothetical protein
MLALAMLATVAAGCVSAPPFASPGTSYPSDLAQAVSETNLTGAGVVSLQVPGAPPALVTIDEAVAIADGRAYGGSARGPIIAVARASARQTPAAPVKTVWVVVYGPGGLFEGQGRVETEAPIHVQIVLVDDQSGAVLSNYLTSG